MPTMIKASHAILANSEQQKQNEVTINDYLPNASYLSVQKQYLSQQMIDHMKQKLI
jgi:hypothetical protein